VTTGGIVPKGNPDRIESTFATKWLRYGIEGVPELTSEGWQSIHGGYDTTNANANPNRVLPVDVLRELEAAGEIGRLHGEYYMTVGSGASVRAAKQFAQEIAGELQEAGVDAVLFTAT
jgi:glycine reductase